MSLIVKKFGGTSLESTERIKSAAKKIYDAVMQKHKVVVVVSAMSGTTNKLASYCSLVSKLSFDQSFAEYDAALSSGEIVTASLMSLALQEMGLKSESCQAWQIKINTTDDYSKALITSIDSDFLNRLLNQNIIPVVAGFQGVNLYNRITTLGRGGSDTTASGIAAALNADICEIYTDVDGVYSADPRMVHNARKIDILSYEEMLTLATCGAKVLHPRSVQIAMKFKVPIRVLSSFEEGLGTIITDKEKIMEKSKITGVAYNNNISLVKIFSAKLEVLEKLSVNSICIENLVYTPECLSFTVPLIEIAKMKELLQGYEIEVNKEIATVSVVAHSINQEIMTWILSIVNGDDILAIISSEVKVSLIVRIKDLERIVNKLHGGVLC